MLRSSLAALPSEHGSFNYLILLYSDLAPRFTVWNKFWVSKSYGKSSTTVTIHLRGFFTPESWRFLVATKKNRFISLVQE